jgi:hypothetical protein
MHASLEFVEFPLTGATDFVKNGTNSFVMDGEAYGR